MYLSSLAEATLPSATNTLRTLRTAPTHVACNSTEALGPYPGATHLVTIQRQTRIRTYTPAPSRPVLYDLFGWTTKLRQRNKQSAGMGDVLAS